MSHTQHLRRSQFVIIYGPGAILEGPKGPRIIPRPDIGLFTVNSRLTPDNLTPDNFEIPDQRISQGLMRNARLFRLPSNAELRIPNNRYIYRTKPFPTWKLCLNIQGHHGNFYVLTNTVLCPICRGSNRRRLEPVRFILACSEGHMDDINWTSIVHGQETSCQHNGWFRWFGGGGTLSRILIQCPICRISRNLGSAYRENWPCSGRFPENEPLEALPTPQPLGAPPTPICQGDARIIQRQASNLRIPELRILLSIPPRSTRLHNLLQIVPILDNIVGQTPSSKSQLENILNNLRNRGRIGESTVNEILRCDWNEIERAIQDNLQPIQNSYHALILEEFHALINSSYHGAPPIRGPQTHSPVIFEVDPHLVRIYNGPCGTHFRITPILRLRTVTAQIGYRREMGTGIANFHDISFPDRFDHTQRWYPGVEFLGEGIFIILENGEQTNQQLSGQAMEEWTRVFTNPSYYPPHVFREPQSRDELNPVFVWWHSLSHLLIRAISREAGYSSTSIRERIYLNINPNQVRGGILLYATQPGSEGTLGGLLALVPNFQSILDTAFRDVEICSGDPLCKEYRFRERKYNGAACFGCLLISETSCEHRNMWLDRNILLENPP